MENARIHLTLASRLLEPRFPQLKVDLRSRSGQRTVRWHQQGLRR
jgi:hypothetical protein